MCIYRAQRDLRTPLHYAAAYGHTEVLQLLIQSGGDINEADFAGATVKDIITSPGPIFKDDASQLLHMNQVDIRVIDRPLHPTYDKTESKPIAMNLGGYDSTRLKGYENALHCDADQYNKGEITGKEIYEKYLALNRPVLIRGLIDDWPAVEKYKRANLYRDHGNLSVHVTSIPYATKFAGSGDHWLHASE